MYMCLQIASFDDWMIGSQKWFSTGKLYAALQSICVTLFGSTRAFVFPADTRFGGKLIQWQNFLSLKPALQQLVRSDRYRQYDFEDDIYADRIAAEDAWSFIDRVVKRTEPVLLLLRLGDSNKATLSKVRGTLDYVRTLMVETGDDSIEDQIAEAFHNRSRDFESDAANCAYIIDPQFIAVSKNAPSDVMDSFWKVSRNIIDHKLTDAQWLPVRTQLATELQAFRMKTGPWALEDYSMEDTVTFWGVAGCHAQLLKQIAFALAPLPCSSGEAERSWHELKLNKTKTRNRLSTERLQKMMFVRRFLHLKRKIVYDHDMGLAAWMKKLLRKAASALGAVENVVPEGGNDTEDLETLTVFDDTITPREQGWINGKEPGKPVVSLTKLRKDKTAQSGLFEKYYKMCFLDKNPEDEDEDDFDVDDEANWEHRVIQNVVWSRRKGYVVETVIMPTDSEEADQATKETYKININLLKMIRLSPHNTRRIKSQMNAVAQSADTDNPPASPHNSDSDSDNNDSSQVATV